MCVLRLPVSHQFICIFFSSQSLVLPSSVDPGNLYDKALLTGLNFNFVVVLFAVSPLNTDWYAAD